MHDWDEERRWAKTFPDVRLFADISKLSVYVEIQVTNLVASDL